MTTTILQPALVLQADSIVIHSSSDYEYITVTCFKPSNEMIEKIQTIEEYTRFNGLVLKEKTDDGGEDIKTEDCIYSFLGMKPKEANKQHTQNIVFKVG